MFDTLILLLSSNPCFIVASLYVYILALVFNSDRRAQISINMSEETSARTAYETLRCSGMLQQPNYGEADST